ncbi:SDR family oxidoreductase, partial [Nocardiopsis sp. MG754419]|uniref:SDR family oxidoreductase n=1 Tax=Nocardiopsis sp. MG754419 TaxID=2259865 RepID=UPI001BA8CABB
MTENTTPRPILVTGATGMTGRRVLSGLRELGLPVRAASRSSAWRFDWNAPETWDEALAGAGSVYLVQHDPAPLTAGFVERAVAHGLERIVLLSARGVDRPGYFDGEAQPITHRLGEQAVRESGLEWTILQPGWFTQNFDEGVLADEVRDGVLRLPAGDGAAAWIDAGDIAAVAVAALTEPGHHGRTYELSGPRAL